MARNRMTDEQWELIEDLFPPEGLRPIKMCVASPTNPPSAIAFFTL